MVARHRQKAAAHPEPFRRHGTSFGWRRTGTCAATCNRRCQTRGYFTIWTMYLSPLRMRQS